MAAAKWRQWKAVAGLGLQDSGKLVISRQQGSHPTPQLYLSVWVWIFNIDRDQKVSETGLRREAPQTLLMLLLRTADSPHSTETRSSHSPRRRTYLGPIQHTRQRAADLPAWVQHRAGPGGSRPDQAEHQETTPQVCTSSVCKHAIACARVCKHSVKCNQFNIQFTVEYLVCFDTYCTCPQDFLKGLLQETKCSQSPLK